MSKYRIFRWTVSVLLGICFFIPVHAQEYSNTDKIDIVGSIVADKTKEGANLSEVLSSVAEKFPLDLTDAELPPDVVRQLEEKVRDAFPLTRENLEAKYAAEAEKKFPLHRVGDVVSVSYYCGGEITTGKFYRQDAHHVWVGYKKIKKSSLAKADLLSFDSVQTEKARRDFVAENVNRYLARKNNYESELKETALNELRGAVLYGGRWISIRELATRKYRRINRDVKIKAVELAMSKARDAQSYEEAIEILEIIIEQYPDAENIEQAKQLCSTFKQIQECWDDLKREFSATVKQVRAETITEDVFLHRLIELGRKAVFIKNNVNLSQNQLDFVKMVASAGESARLYYFFLNSGSFHQARESKKLAVDFFGFSVHAYNKGL